MRSVTVTVTTSFRTTATSAHKVRLSPEHPTLTGRLYGSAHGSALHDHDDDRDAEKVRPAIIKKFRIVGDRIRIQIDADATADTGEASAANAGAAVDANAFDRQIRAFGQADQATLHGLNI